MRAGLLFAPFPDPPGVARPPLNRVFAATMDLPSILLRWFPGDNDTALLVEIVLAEDTLLKRVHRPDRFEAVARAVPSIAPWLECADPTTGVFAMGALRNTLRRTVQHGQPLVLGLLLIGDATCTTNPTGGRGVSYAIAMAGGAAQAIANHPDDVTSQALLLDNFITREIEPRFLENVRSDVARVQQMRADLTGSARADMVQQGQRLRLDELVAASMEDADLYRVLMRYVMVLGDAPDLSDPSLIERVRRHNANGIRPRPTPGPSRAELMQILAGI